MKRRIPETKFKKKEKLEEINLSETILPVTKERKIRLEATIKELEIQIKEIEDELVRAEVMFLRPDGDVCKAILSEEDIKATDKTLINKKRLFEATLKHIMKTNETAKVVDEVRRNL